MADNKNKSGEFDEFDDDDFSDVDFEDTTLDDAADFDALAEEDAGDDEDFDSGEDWDDPAQEAQKKADKKLLSGGEKKGGLSFNTMAIIGAVVLGGGIMVFNVMKETAKKEANPNQVAFQSSVDMNSVTGGDAFNSDQVATVPEQPAPAVETPVPAANSGEQGFLDNPSDMATATTTPPQPTPIAPSENDTVTPMPSAEEMPRTPDQAPVEQAAVEAAPVMDQAENQPAPSAEDILKKAMENREQKMQETTAVAETSAPVPAEPVAPEKVAEPVNPPVPVAEPVAQAAVTTPALDNEGLLRIEEKLNSLTDRMTQIENNIGSMKDSKETDYVEIQQAVADLKEDMQSLKDRPAVAPTTKTASNDNVEKPVATTKPKTTTAKKSKPASAKTAAPKSDMVWELRAAQPGRAWVSKPGANDMQSIVVGQSLPGIGQVSAITYQNGRWTVYGTTGQIRQ